MNRNPKFLRCPQHCCSPQEKTGLKASCLLSRCLAVRVCSQHKLSDFNWLSAPRWHACLHLETYCQHQQNGRVELIIPCPCSVSGEDVTVYEQRDVRLHTDSIDMKSLFGHKDRTFLSPTLTQQTICTLSHLVIMLLSFIWWIKLWFCSVMIEQYSFSQQIFGQIIAEKVQV